MSKIESFLKFIEFRDIDNWSVSHILESTFSYNEKYPLVKIGEFLKRNKTVINIEDNKEYKRVTIKINNGGVFLRDIKKGSEIGTKKQYLIKKGQFLLSKIDARNGAFGVVPDEVDNAIITGNFWTFDVDYNKINPYFLSLITTTKEFIKFCANASNGTTNRHYLQEDAFLNVKIPLPSLEEQNRLLRNIDKYSNLLKSLKVQHKNLIENFNKIIFSSKITKKETLLNFISFNELSTWSVSRTKQNNFNYNEKYPLVKIGEFLKRNKTVINIEDNKEYKRVTIKINNGGVFLRDIKRGSEIGTKKQYLIKKGQFLLSKIDARNGAFGLATDEVDGAIITADFFAYDIDTSKIEPYFLVLLTTTKQFKNFAQSASSGTTNRQRIKEENFLNIEIPLPSLEEQREIIEPIIENLKQQNEAKKNREFAIKEFEREIFQTESEKVS